MVKLFKEYEEPFNKNKVYDVHCQVRDYGYCLCNRQAETLEDLIVKAINKYWSLLRNSNNSLTRERVNNGYFKNHPVNVTITDKDGFKGIIIW